MSSRSLETIKIGRRALQSHAVPTWGLAGVLLAYMALCTIVGVAFHLHAVMIWPALIGMFTIIGAAALYLNLKGEVQLGADGIHVDRRDDRRYVPYSDVLDVSPHHAAMPGKTYVGVALDLAGGERFILPIGDTNVGGGARMHHLMDRINARRDEHSERSSSDVTEDALARGDRTPDAWIQRLHNVGEGANANAREAPVDTDKLWRIVENPSADPIARGGAATALTMQDGSADRLRIVLDETAEPRLRVALECALEGDDAALAEALSDLERADS